jgi:filamentous hemagglutinin family protein
VYTIAGGTTQGPNLFHSFDRFEVGTRDTARFTRPNTPNTIDNIISRVTGGHVSHIDGTIRSEIAGANLYLLKPSGMVFGPNARLDVQGSFHVSTAEVLRFADGYTFRAVNQPEPLLTVESPTAFGFLGPQPPAPLTVRGSSLRVADGHTLSLVGGTIEIVRDPETSLSPELLALQGGRLQIASVAAPGDVVLQTPEQTPVFEVDGIQSLGKLTIADAPAVGCGGFPCLEAGTVLLRGGRMEISNANMAGGRVVMRGGDVTITNEALIEGLAPQGQDGTTLGIDIRVEGAVVISGGSLINALPSRVRGDARDIQITADSLRLERAIVVSQPIAGASGTITVDVTQLALAAGGQISATSLSDARAGTVRVTATEVTIQGEDPDIGLNQSGIFSAALRGNTGGGGNITMEVGTLALQDGGVISTSTRSQGPGGQVTIRATDRVMITGQGQLSREPSQILSVTNGPGAAGEVNLTAPRVQIENGGRIATNSTQSDSGRGGTVTVRVTDTVSLTGSDSGLFSDTASGERGGDIDLQAHTIELTDGAVISAQSTGLGDAGTLTITARDTVLLRDDSAVTTLATQAGGGNITVTGNQLVRLTDSVVTAEARGQEPDDRGGNVTINSAFVILDHSRVQANAVAGNGGDITINATEAFLADVETCANEECFDASSQLANPGRIVVQAPVTDLSSIVVPLPQRFAQAAELLRQHCAERLRGSEASSFIVAGREQVPIEPDGVLPSPPSMDGNITSLSTRAAKLARRGTNEDIVLEQLWGSEGQTLPQMALDLDCRR